MMAHGTRSSWTIQVQTLLVQCLFGSIGTKGSGHDCGWFPVWVL